jgi:hypothetical protein
MMMPDPIRPAAAAVSKGLGRPMKKEIKVNYLPSSASCSMDWRQIVRR